MRNDIIFKLTTEDVQDVALKEIGRELTPDELKSLNSFITDNIKWQDVVADAITENVKSNDLLYDDV